MSPIYNYCHLRNINNKSEHASSVVYLVFKASFTIYNVWNAAFNMPVKYCFFCSVHCWLQPTQPLLKNIRSTSLPLMDDIRSTSLPLMDPIRITSLPLMNAWFPYSCMAISEYHWSIFKYNVYGLLKSLYSDLFSNCNDLIFFIS